MYVERPVSKVDILWVGGDGALCFYQVQVECSCQDFPGRIVPGYCYCAGHIRAQVIFSTDDHFAEGPVIVPLIGSEGVFAAGAIELEFKL